MRSEIFHIIQKYMSKTKSIAIVITFLVLNFLALDDITTGSEPDYNLEWGFVVFSLIMLAIYLARMISSRKALN